jgi:ribose 5-phosphate isomerase B
MIESLGHQVTDFGTHSTSSMDYPDISHPLALSVEKKETELGIIICGSGNGVNMAVNKHQGIRGALCWTEEISTLARTHNDANVLALPARFIDIELAKKIVLKFLNTSFEGGRHQNRVDKIHC